jgi:hypothetical protein
MYKVIFILLFNYLKILPYIIKKIHRITYDYKQVFLQTCLHQAKFQKIYMNLIIRSLGYKHGKFGKISREMEWFLVKSKLA